MKEVLKRQAQTVHSWSRPSLPTDRTHVCTQKGTQHCGLTPISRHALPISACEKPVTVDTQRALLKARDQYHFDQSREGMVPCFHSCPKPPSKGEERWRNGGGLPLPGVSNQNTSISSTAPGTSWYLPPSLDGYSMARPASCQ